MKKLNSVDFDTPHGLRSAEIWSGDILEQEEKTDLLIVSLFGRSLEPTPSSLVGQIHKRGLDSASLYHKKEFDLRGSLNTWLSPEVNGLPCKRMLFLEIQRGGFQNSNTIQEAFDNLFLSLLILEKKGFSFRSIALPILGAGDQGLDEEILVPELIRTARRSLFELKHTEIIKFIERDTIKAGMISSEVNIKLGRKNSLEKNDDMIVFARTQLKSLIEKIGYEDSATLKELYETINNSNLKGWEIGIHTRRTLEWLLNKIDCNGDTSFEKISSLDKQIPDIIVSYMHLARKIGNTTAHNEINEKQTYTPCSVDITINLLCLKKLLTYYVDTN